MGELEGSMRQISVESFSNSMLERTVYEYTIIDMTVYLDKMLVMTRETKRHGFKLDMLSSYSRLNSRDFGVKEEPDVDILIQVQVLESFRREIKIQKWNRA